MRRSWAKTSLVLFTQVVAFSGCSSATGPDESTCYVEPPSGLAQATLYRVSGPGTCGTGGTSITTTPNGGTMSATMKFRVRGAKPNTVYFIQRAAEFPVNSSSADSVCQRADGQAPWTPGSFPGQTWVTFPLPYADQGPVKTLTTDAAGDASIDFVFLSPQIAAGTIFDLAMRIVDSDVGDTAGVTSELRSGCMKIQVL
jgi:hypothetical protein